MIKMINIAICGCNGKMGHVIYSCLSDREGCAVVGGIDLNTAQYADFPIVTMPGLLPVRPDVIIDYSHPSTLNGLLSYALTNGVAVVFATTGYSEEQISQIKAAAEQVPVFFTFNLSLG
ncbi:MAG: 4-hydroxy-tetrahydrodipicolinate reductase, partial [Oscillospiraceae bacterium]